MVNNKQQKFKRKSSRQSRRKTKGQMMGMVFIMILGAMIFMLILMYGYKAINNFLEKQEQVALIEFQTELESSIKEISLDFGSVKKLELRLTSKAREVCFISDPNANSNGDSFEAVHPLLFDAFLSGTQNVFLVPLSESAIFLENIEVKDNWFCSLTPSGKITLRVEGLGNKAGISEWVNN